MRIQLTMDTRRFAKKMRRILVATRNFCILYYMIALRIENQRHGPIIGRKNMPRAPLRRRRRINPKE